MAASSASAAPAAPSQSLCPDAASPVFGPNVCVFSDTITQTAIQADLNAIATQQVPVGSQFDSNRYTAFFEPGTYGSAADPLVFQVGYYTQVAGLGAQSPRRTRSAGPSSTAASCSRTTAARCTTTPAAVSSPTARSAAA